MSIAFADLGVPADLGAVLRKRGITSPFPIQAATLPDVLAGRDVSGRAPTGSGKTIAFALAIVARTRKPVPRRPRALVLAPTRELARQIEQELTPLVAARGGRVVAVYGGTGYGPQCRALSKGVSVVVGCPGRLEDLIQRGDVRLDEVNLVVVDEADRMADMGFLPAVRRLLDGTAPEPPDTPVLGHPRWRGRCAGTPLPARSVASRGGRGGILRRRRAHVPDGRPRRPRRCHCRADRRARKRDRLLPNPPWRGPRRPPAGERGSGQRGPARQPVTGAA